MSYEGEGELTFHAGDNCLQPAGIVQTEIQCSSDLECLEIDSPARRQTQVVDEQDENISQN